MNEEEKNLNEEIEETTEEVIDNAVEEIVEAKSAETVIGGEESELDSSDVMAVGEVTDTTEEAEVIEETDENSEEASEDGTAAAAAIEAEIAEDGTVTEGAQTPVVTDAKNQALAKTAAIIVAAVVLIAIIVLGIIFCPRIFNKYNRSGYIDVSGRTIAEVADNSGMELEDFLESFGLPTMSQRILRGVKRKAKRRLTAMSARIISQRLRKSMAWVMKLRAIQSGRK